MTHLFREAATPAELGWVGGSLTLLFLLVFVSWTIWTFMPSRKQAMEEAARMPLEDGGDA